MQSPLSGELDALPAAVTARLASHGFDRGRLLDFAARLGDPSLFDNHVRGTIEPPPKEDILQLPERGSARAKDLATKGEALIAEGRCALVVLAGGMATRMGGVVK